MYSEPNEIKTKHKGDILTLWKIYVSDKRFYQNFYFRLSLILSLIFLLFSLLSKTTSYSLMLKIAEISLNILPNLLGFNLGAYILIVGFGGIEILNIITKPLRSQSDYSFYQKLNGVLGIAVVIQIISLLTFFFVKIWDHIQDNLIHLPHLFHCILFVKFINSTALVLVAFLSFYSILLLINVVKHVFMFAQTIHFCIYNEKLISIEKERTRKEKIKKRHKKM